MVKVVKTGIIISLIGFLAFSCSKKKECASIQPIQPIASFQIVDANGLNLIGDGLTYDFEDIQLFNDALDIPLGINFSQNGDEAAIWFDYFQLISGEAYNLKLNDTETDILRFQFYIEEGNCFDLKLIENVNLNNIQLDLSGTNSNRLFVIVK
ncbi:hypothetical protein [Ulvibacter antarcticus]|uniref:Lipoprotein n=1 Tax=Ulvibacter antarcticus TaxID=442714 RepID=A0A3L9YUR5_9FLAO|nr:hypothetical protein [Ulvibacter antarcticus]RMA64481.1 hypothetical protein BXY75_1357 [Ulvibacter antarcticus]